MCNSTQIKLQRSDFSDMFTKKYATLHPLHQQFITLSLLSKLIYSPISLAYRNKVQICPTISAIYSFIHAVKIDLYYISLNPENKYIIKHNNLGPPSSLEKQPCCYLNFGL
jgi:hypothetical protein